MIAALSTLNSTRPALTSRMARSRSKVIVPDLGLGIRPRRPRMRPSLPDHAHHVGRREGDVEVEPARLDALGQVLATDFVGAGAQRLLRLLGLGEHDDADALARAVRQHDRAAHHLVGVAGIDAEADVGLGGRVETDVARLLEQVHRLVGRVGALAVDELGGSWYFLPAQASLVSSVAARLERRASPDAAGCRPGSRWCRCSCGATATSIPIERAVPSMILAAARCRWR